MKKRNIKVHILYWLLIGMITVSGAGAIVWMRNEQKVLLDEAATEETLDREQLVGAIGQAENALRMAAYCESPAVYAAKMQALAENCASAALLTEQRDPSSVWMMLWTKLSAFAGDEIASAVGKSKITPNLSRLESYADLLARLKAEPDALGGPLWTLPEGLAPPKLQTEFSLSEDALKTKASKILNVGGGLLKKVDSGLPGVVRYRCSNAEIDLLISGSLVYLDLQLPRGNGNIGREEGIERLTAFAGQEGYGGAKVTDLYEKEGVLWAKMAETVALEPYGAVKNLDRSFIAACTLWSGRVCHFEVDAVGRITQPPASQMSGGLSTARLLSEKKLKKLAEARQAVLGEAVICKGRLCRTLIVGQTDEGSSVHLYLDAVDGVERGVDLRMPPLADELPASAEWGIETGERNRSAPSEGGEWQRRRSRRASLESKRTAG